MQQEVKSVEALLNKAVLLMNGAELLELLHQVKGTEVKEEKKQSPLNDYPNLPQFITGIKELARRLGISASTVNRIKAEGLLDDAIFQNGKMIKKSRCNVSGSTINIAIKNWLFKSYNMNVSTKQVEKIKRKIGQVNIQQNPKSLEVVGMDQNSHVLKSAIINENQIVGILTPLVQQWANWILQFLSSLPITMQQDVKTRGIICCGGSMLLNGLPSYLQNTIGCPIFVTDDPINTVSAGLMILLSRMED